jgi:hypothetical protein
MGFNKMFLPEVEDLKQFLAEHGEERFYERWVVTFMKRDAIIGPDASFEFIKQFLDREYNNNKPNSQLSVDLG